MSAQNPQRLTPRDLFGLTRTRAVVLLTLFTVTEATLGLTGGGRFAPSWQVIVSLILICGCAVVSLLPGASPLGLRTTLLAVAVVGVSTAVMSWSLPTNGGAFSYASWHLGANTFLLFALALRGRILWSWAGIGLMSAITILWTVVTGQGAATGLDLMVRQWGTLMLGTLFAIALARSARSIQSATDLENKRLIDAEVERAAADERSRHLRELERLAGPALREIAAGGAIDADRRSQYLVLEAALRDRLRAIALSREPLSASARRARLRGVDVILLDDSAGAVVGDAQSREIAQWIADHLESVSRGTFTARLRPDPAGLSATIVSGDLRLSRSFPPRPSGRRSSARVDRAG